MTITPVRPAILPDDTARARYRDPQESHDAADLSAKNRRLVMDTVFARLLEHPSTDHELEEWYAANAASLPPAFPGTPRKRRSDLKRDGLVVATEVKRKHPDSAFPTTVWAVAL